MISDVNECKEEPTTAVLIWFVITPKDPTTAHVNQDMFLPPQESSFLKELRFQGRRRKISMAGISNFAFFSSCISFHTTN